ncbi:MAG: response regulator transcription factor, partial [Caldilineaceae bacterium]|nr:response regulator transcription factor [Caldilineaceae bacterium]
NQEIADRLFIELGTVKNHVHHILDKLNVNSRQDAASYLNLVQNHNAVVDIEPDETSNE